MNNSRNATRKRNRGYEETHQALIETAVRMLSERGADALSVSALAREMGLNRTTVYYHFPSRDAMVRAVKDWSAEQLARGMDTDAPQVERMEHITRFVLDNPELIKLWIDDFLAPGDIRARYTRWDQLVAGMAKSFANVPDGEGFDAEVYSVMLLSAAIIGPRVFQSSINPALSASEIAERFNAEQKRQLRRDALLR